MWCYRRSGPRGTGNVKPTGPDPIRQKRCGQARRCELAMVAALALAAFAVAASAQDYPSRPIRLVVGFAAGGTTDFMARLLADRMRGALGETVFVENKTGANGAIGAEFVAKSEPDGYTLYFTTAGVATVYPHLGTGVPYDPIRDFTPVGRVAFNSTMLVVSMALPIGSARELAALARQQPGRVTLAITGLGSVSHLGIELFQAAANVKFLIVPYRGMAPAMSDLIGGQLDGLFGDGPTVMPQVAAGRIKPLAALSTERSEIFPEVPTLREQGIDAVADQWAGVLAPARTPAAIIVRLNGSINTAMNDPALRTKLAQTGTVPAPDTPEHFTEYLKDEYARWGRIIRERGLKN